MIGKNNPSWKGGRITKKCIFCEKDFLVYPYRKYTALFCSRKCSNNVTLNNKGRRSKVKHTQGYIMLWTPGHPYAKNGYVLEHRLKMEEYMGRFLNKEEVVHHIDGDKTNNSIENLILLNNQSEHMKLEMSLRRFFV